VGATGAGALAAALLLAFRGDIRDKGRFISVAALSASVSLLAFSLSKNIFISIPFLLIVGWGLVSFLATANSYIQLSAPDNLRGRVMSVFTLVFLGTAPIGNSLVGAMADYIGTPYTVSISAVICIIASLLFAMRRNRGKGEQEIF
jgi:predicted MFS family arabinose efflux permease